jgi:hypothetical protein
MDLSNTFGISAQQENPAEKTLRELGCAFEKRADGALVVAGDIDLAGRNLRQLPDLTSVIVNGNFFCNNNQLSSLKGAPTSVGGSFICDDNRLTSLEHAPTSVGGDFFCRHNELTSLKGATPAVGGSFICGHNQLADLDGSPTKFKKLYSDLGAFAAWEDVPEKLRVSSETKAQRPVPTQKTARAKAPNA